MNIEEGWLQWFLASLWFPFAAGLLIQMAVTQWGKLYLPVSWDDNRRRRTINAIAFFAGAIPTAAIMAGQGCDPYQLWLAVVVGFSGPALYKVATTIIYSKWPDLEGTLSAHGRARRKRNGQA